MQSNFDEKHTTAHSIEFENKLIVIRRQMVYDAIFCGESMWQQRIAAESVAVGNYIQKIILDFGATFLAKGKVR